MITLGSEDKRLKYIMDGRVKIRPKKGGKVVPLVPSRIQRKVLTLIDEDIRAGRPIRQLDLKPRQVMMSSIIAAFLYAWARTAEGCKFLVAAQKKGTVDDLWAQKYQTFKNHDEDEPETKYDSKETMRFIDTESQIDVRIGDPDLGRGGTLQGLHLTEFPYMKNPDLIWQEVVPCVPADEPDTAIFIESTGARAGDLYERMFRDSWAAQEKGELLKFRALFFPWTDQEDYEKQLSRKEESDLEEKLTAEEKGLMRMHGLTLGHVAWRREQLAIFQNDRAAFVNKYPLTPDEAFAARLESCFDQKAMGWYGQVMIREPKRRVIISLSGIREPHLHEHESGSLWIWQPPAHGYTYSMYMDPAGFHGEESTEFHSKSAMAVVENETGEVVATWSDRLHPADFARVGYALGTYYNTATIAVEVNNHGALTFDELFKRLRYKRPFWNHDYRGSIREKQMGVTLDQNKRAEIVGVMQKLIAYKQLGLHCKRTFEQMQTFVKPVSGSARAKKGHNDDLVIATAGAAWVASKDGAEWAVREDESRQRMMAQESSRNKGRLWIPGMEDDLKRLALGRLGVTDHKSLVDMIMSGND